MLRKYPKDIVTSHGLPLVLRPLVREDEKALTEFFSRLSDEERWFRRHNLADPAVLREWIEDLDHDRILILVAVDPANGHIVGNARLHRRPTQCLRHIAHLRLMVDPMYRNRGVGTQILLDITELAKEACIERLVAEFVIGVEDAAMIAAKKMDFFQQAVLHNYLKDRDGNYHDLSIMVKILEQGMSDF